MPDRYINTCIADVAMCGNISFPIQSPLKAHFVPQCTVFARSEAAATKHFSFKEWEGGHYS